MKYRIGEISEMLNISVETIRFYESQRVVNPKRSLGSSYREYDSWDVFYLMDCIRMRSLGLSLKDTARILHDESQAFLGTKIREQRVRLDESIQYSNLLAGRYRDLENVLEAIQYNLGSYWIKVVPARYCFRFTTREANEFSQFRYTSPLFRKLLDCYPFVDSCQHIGYDAVRPTGACPQAYAEDWSLSLEAKYAEYFKIPVESLLFVPERLCLTTIVDIGDTTENNVSYFRPAVEYLSNTDYELAGDILGTLHWRIPEGESLRRYSELLVPIKKNAVPR